MTQNKKKTYKSEMGSRVDTSESRLPPDIIVAAFDGNVSRVKELLESGDDVNTTDPRDNLSLLHIGCMHGDGPLVDLILEWDRKYGSVDFSIRTLYRPRLAWQTAMTAGYVEIAHRVDFAGLAKTTPSSPRIVP